MKVRHWQDRIIMDRDIHHGDPCIKGTRIPVAVVVGSLADGLSFDEIREAYPQLTNEDIYATLAYAAEVMRQEIVSRFPLSAFKSRSSVKIKVDEDLPGRVVALLRDKGYQADSVVELGMSRWKDAELWRKIQTGKTTVVTPRGIRVRKSA